MKLSAAVFEAIDRLKQSDDQWEDFPATLPDGTPATVRAIKDGKFFSLDMIWRDSTFPLRYGVPFRISDAQKNRLEHYLDYVCCLEVEETELRHAVAQANRRIEEIKQTLRGNMLLPDWDNDRQQQLSENKSLLASAGF